MAAVVMITQKMWLHVQDLYAKVCENGSPSWDEGSEGVGETERVMRENRITICCVYNRKEKKNK